LPQTSNKGLEVQLTGSNSGTWGDVLNDQMIAYVDLMLGGLLTLSLSASNVVLTTAQARNAIVRCTGVLLASVQITSPCIGFYFVENLTTGSHSVTVTNGVSGVVVPQGTRAALVADGTNGVRLGSQSLGYVAGTTKQPFVNSTVPTGWQADTSVNNGTLRLVSSGGGGTGGTADFTTVFAARTIAALNLPNLTLSVTDPGHAHPFTAGVTTGNVQGGGGENVSDPPAGSTTGSATTGISVAINDAARGGAQTPMDFAVKYRDALIGTLNG